MMGDGAGLLPLVLTGMCRSNYLVSKHVVLKDASNLHSDSNESTDTFPSRVKQASHRDDFFFRYSESSQFRTLNLISARRKIL